jgi:hypothetical protein
LVSFSNLLYVKPEHVNKHCIILNLFPFSGQVIPWHNESQINKTPQTYAHGTHVRRNQIIDAGICGLAGASAIHTLVEFNLIENIGWQNAELAWESGGLKFHGAEGTVIRNNVIRHTIYAPGIWLGYCKLAMLRLSASRELA